MRAVDPGAFGLRGKKKIVVVRSSGAITGGSKPQGGQIVADPLIRKLSELAERKDVAGIVLRIDSPGVLWLIDMSALGGVPAAAANLMFAQRIRTMQCGRPCKLSLLHLQDDKLSHTS